MIFTKLSYVLKVLVLFFTGKPYQKLFGRSLANVKHLTIDARVLSLQMEPPQLLLNWLLEFAYTKSLTVTASNLQIT
jgi:hypothetical protein